MSVYVLVYADGDLFFTLFNTSSISFINTIPKPLMHIFSRRERGRSAILKCLKRKVHAASLLNMKNVLDVSLINL